MFGIGHFFQRIQNKYTKELFLRQAIIEAIKKHVGIDIDVKDIAIKNGLIILANTNQSVKSVLYIKKSAILREINSLQGVASFTDIK